MDTGEIYQKMTLHILQTKVVDIEWLKYLNMFLPTKVSGDEPVVLYSLPYLKRMGEIIRSTNRR